MKRSQLRKDDGCVRLSHELSEGEKKATGKRKEKVLKCLKSLAIACDEDNMPNIAVLGSGGGLRAMIALQGTLVEMKQQGLLDAVLYLCGVSGSTWCMSFLYQENDWTEKVQVLEERLCDTLSKPQCDIQEEFTIATQAAEDELFSLTDVWASFFVYPTLKLYDKTKLSEHKDTSTNGTNPYPIYAAIEANQLHKKAEKSPGTWFEFTPHESGFPSLGAFVCTEDLGSKFEDGNLKEKRDEKNICYLQGLWGSALGSMEENMNYLIDLLKQIFRKLREQWWYAVYEAGGQEGTPGSVPFSGPDCSCARCQGVHHLLELHVHTSAGKDCEGVFRQLKEVLKEENSKSSFLKCCEMSVSWHLKTLEEKIVEFAHLIRIFENELGGTDCKSAHCGDVLLLLELHIHASSGKDCKEILRQKKEENSKSSFLKLCEVSVSWNLKSWEDWIEEFVEHIWNFVKELGGYVWSVWQLLWKTVICICNWTWGCTNNFLYKSSDAQSTGLTNEEFIYLIDAGTDINSAYPLVLRPERKVKLILSFDFSSGNPFETIENTAKYCEINNIPFPKIKPEEIKDKDNPTDCYIFKGKDVPTVMHFPLFNNKNCPGEIESFRNKFSTFRSCYLKEDIKELLSRAKLNVSNNTERIREEIQQIVSSSTKEF
ncbi:cytosolic phospholipase A2 gamma-like isoform X2 [Trachemys scripta elegans]|uniref:cytosolic phospholipase A2 gamma-like isoform X2 n=1 Tax=Trachemys scripta elegans TaxID=31138 RepID=UPI0015571A09|nr:cytosolic phospholipase A2 gamma-like isoform X2 [Trachemys scripta elegans]